MKKLITSLILSLLLIPTVRADEGMWMLPYLEKLNIKDIRKAGAKLSAKDIYNANGTSIKDAIVHFGGGCTGEVVSAEGLVFTNHHCGYGAIQKVSTMERDYLKNGFWAMERAQEIHCPGLIVKFVRHIIDVTEQFDKEVKKNSNIIENAKQETRSNIIAQYKDKFPGMEISISPFFGESQYFIFVTEVYNDIRLVGAPPTFIGKFGGETDNWMWPRHTGDFSVFRIYADKDGKSAKYSPSNIPLETPKFLEISAKGYKENDFAMIIGFPGSTQRYMTSYELDKRMNVDNATRIFVRGVRQDILLERMKSSDKIRLQYASKYAGSSNYWKNSIGMNQALKKHGIKAKKEAFEQEFQTWANKPGNEEYKNVLRDIKESVYPVMSTAKTDLMLNEAINRSVELLNLAKVVTRFTLDIAKDNSNKSNLKSAVKLSGEEFYRDYDLETDRLVASAMFKIISDSLSPADRPSFFESEIGAKFNGDIEAYLDNVYSTSVLRDQETFNKFIESESPQEIFKTDPTSIAFNSLLEKNISLVVEIYDYQTKLSKASNLLIKGTLAMNPSQTYYPDANSTIRFTYGKVKPYEPRDAVNYNYYTTLSGVMEKENSDIYEFTIPQRLKDLYKAKDFGPYAYKGDIPVCFITTNDITGGNSGSPVLDSHGRLLGLAFDGNWEALSGDIMFDPEQQRCINVDIRYVLFIIDKYAGSPIMKELKIVR